MTAIFASWGELVGYWRADRARLLAELVLCFIALGFVVHPEPPWADLFYLIILPLALWRAYVTRSRWNLAAMPVHLILASALIIWFTLTLAWDGTAQARPVLLGRWLLNGLATLVFVHSLSRAFSAAPEFRTRLVRAIILFAVINAIIAFVRLPFDPIANLTGVLRMGGWAETRHPILGAAIMGSAVLFAVSRAVERRDLWLWGAALIGLVFIALTGSRGPAGAVVIAVAFQLGWAYPRVLAALVLAGAVVLGLALAVDYSFFAHLWQTQAARGDSHRFEIWLLSWADIQQAFWLGHGPEYRLHDRPNEDFPHNLFLSTWFYAGLIGLLLLLGYLAAASLKACRAPSRADRALRLSLLLNMVLCGMTDFGQVIKGPGPIWFLIWLPTLFAATLEERKRV